MKILLYILAIIGTPLVSFSQTTNTDANTNQGSKSATQMLQNGEGVKIVDNTNQPQSPKSATQLIESQQKGSPVQPGAQNAAQPATQQSATQQINNTTKQDNGSDTKDSPK